MAKVAFDVYEWRIENFSCWDAEVHGDSIDSPELALRYVFYMELFPRGESGMGKHMKVSLITANAAPPKHSGGNLSFIDSEGSPLCTKQIHSDGRFVNSIKSGLTFEMVAAKIKKKEGDRLILRLCLPSGKDHAVTVSTTLDVFNLSMHIDRKSIKSLQLDDSKNISIIRYFKKNELLLKAIRKKEAIDFILELLTKPQNSISVESQWSLQSTDKTFVRKEEKKKYLFHYCEPWKFTNSLNWCELVTKGNTMLLSLKIVTGNQIEKTLHYPQKITAVPRETVSFFDRRSIKSGPEKSARTYKPGSGEADASSIGAIHKIWVNLIRFGGRLQPFPGPIKSKDSVTSNKTGDSSEQEVTKALMSVYQDYQKFSDITLKCDNVSFPVHKVILSARSPVFDRLLSSDMKEAASGSVDIGDLDPSTLSRFLTYLYTGAVEEDLQDDRALKLYYAADKYQVPSLKRKCSDFLSANLSLTNVCDILSLAHKHRDDELTSAAQDFVLDHCNEVLTSKEWGNLLKAEPVLVAETLSSFAAKSSFQSTPLWMNTPKETTPDNSKKNSEATQPSKACGPQLKANEPVKESESFCGIQ